MLSLCCVLPFWKRTNFFRVGENSYFFVEWSVLLSCYEMVRILCRSVKIRSFGCSYDAVCFVCPSHHFCELFVLLYVC